APEIGAPHALSPDLPPRLSHDLMPHGEGRADSAPRVTGCRLDVDVPETPVAIDGTIAHAVQRDAPRHAEPVAPRHLPGRPGESEHDLRGDVLDGGRHVHVELIKRFALAATPLPQMRRQPAIATA